MRTCSEYINEAKQNYIFGGTDNRGTEDVKTFFDLKKGDTIYVHFGKEDVILRLKFLKFVMSNLENKCYVRYAIGSYNESDNFSVKNFFPYSKHSNLTTIIAKTDLDVCIVSTDLYDMLSEMNTKEQFKRENGSEWSEKNVLSLDDNTIDESKQKYIFGGIDDRNTNVDEKKFKDVKKGDYIYWWSNVRDYSDARRLMIYGKEINQTSIVFQYKNNNAIHHCEIQSDAADLSVWTYTNGNLHWCVATNEYEFKNTLREKFGLKEDKYNIQVYESEDVD